MSSLAPAAVFSREGHTEYASGHPEHRLPPAAKWLADTIYAPPPRQPKNCAVLAFFCTAPMPVFLGFPTISNPGWGHDEKASISTMPTPANSNHIGNASRRQRRPPSPHPQARRQDGHPRSRRPVPGRCGAFRSSARQCPPGSTGRQ